MLDQKRKRTILVTRADTRTKMVIPCWQVKFVSEPQTGHAEGARGASSVRPLPTGCFIHVKGYSTAWPLAEKLEEVQAKLEGLE